MVELLEVTADLVDQSLWVGGGEKLGVLLHKVDVGVECADVLLLNVMLSLF